jgi:phage gp29-like protein
MSISTTLAALPGLFLRALTNLRKRPKDLAPPSLWMSPGRIGGELNPQQVSAIMQDADTGYGYYRLVDLFDEARQKDCHLHAVLSTLELSIADMEIQVVPASEKRRDRMVAKFVEGFLGEFGATVDDNSATDLAGLIQHLVGGYVYSFAVAEILYEKRNGRLIPVSADPVMPRRFTFDPSTTDLHFWDSVGTIPYPGINLRKEYPNRFIQFQPRVTGSGPAREGLIRPLLWAALFRNWTIRDWMALAEMSWKPNRIGYYLKTASNDDIVALRNALNYLSTNGATLLPETVNLKYEWPSSSGRGGSESPHMALATYMADEMSKAVLGSTLTTQQGRTGAMALGQVHNEVRQDRRNAAGKSIAGVLRRDLVAPPVRMNFGEGVPVPGIRLIPKDVADPVAMATVIKQLADPKIGMQIPVAWIRKLFGIPTPKEGEEVLGQIVLPRIPETAETTRMRVRLVEEDERVALTEALAEIEAEAAMERRLRLGAVVQ